MTLLRSPFAGAASAQSLPPRVELELLLKEAPSSLPVGAVGVGNCFAPVLFGERTEVAVLTISVNGSWERSAEHLAKQKAAEAGANCLQPLASYGPEEENFPVIRQYRAYLVTTSATTIDGTFRFPASPRTFAPPPEVLPSLSSAFAAPPPAAAQPSAAGSKEDEGELSLAPAPEGTDPLWISGPHITTHEIVLDLGRISPRKWADVRADIRKYFPPAEFETLKKAKRDGRKVTINLKEMTIVPQGGDF